MEQSGAEAISDILGEMERQSVSTYLNTFKGEAANIFKSEPRPLADVHSWKYSELKKLAYEIRSRVDPETAERINIQLENPGLRKIAPEIPGTTTPTMLGAIQLVLDGDRAPTHRHTPNAIRVGLEAPEDGVTTVVNGYRVPIRTGDVLLTPRLTWHDHSNSSGEPAVWLDCLDTVFTYWLGASRFNTLESVEKKAFQDVKGNEDDVSAMYGSNVFFEDRSGFGENPLWYYPYRTVRKSLELKNRHAGGKGAVTAEMTNPATGGPALSTMKLRMTMVMPGEGTVPVRSTENRIIVPIEGSADIYLHDRKRKVHLEDHDVMVVPSWTGFSAENNGSGPLVFFVNSDAPVFQYTNLYRSEEVRS